MNQIIPSINACLALLVVLISFIFAILVLVRTSRTSTYIIFIFICLSNICWNFGDFMTFFTGSRNWYYFSRIGSSMLPALMFHFIITLVKSKPKRATWLRLPYVLSGLFAFFSFFAMFHPEPRWVMDSGLRNILYLVLLSPILLMGIGVVLVATRRTKLKDERERLRYILIASIIGVSTGLTELVQFSNGFVPHLGHLGCLAYSSILAVSIFKHRTAYDILAQMQVNLEFLGEMAAGIAHEIRNPLTSIKGAANLLVSELRNMNLPNVHEYHDTIREEIERLNHILLNFQYFTKPLKVEKELISISEVIQKTIQLAETSPINIKIRQEISRNLPKVKADASLLKQVFLNLIKNAEEACGSGAELLIKTETIPSWLRISFSDNGPGIPDENIKRIFEPFFTTDSYRMGMGLAICKRIIQAHGGKLEVKNRFPNGTEFTLLLPT